MSKIFSQSFLVSLDSKNRVMVPAAFRECLNARAGNTVTEVALQDHEKHACVRVLDVSLIEGMYAKYEQDYGSKLTLEQDEEGARLFSSIVTVSFDTAGRIILAEPLRRLLKFDESQKQVLLLGSGSYFMIWNPDVAEAQFNLDGRITRILDKHGYVRKLAA